MTPIRYNGFNMIHKALRLMLYETATAIQRTDFSNVKQAEPVIAQIEMVVDTYEEHAGHEDAILLPAISRHNAALVKQFEGEHEEDHRIGENLLRHISAWKAAKDDNARFEEGRQIHYAFNDFAAFNLSHMNREETLLNAEFWKHYTDAELMQFTQQIIQRVQPQSLMQQTQWMFRAASTPELAMVLQGVQKTAPAEVFNGYMKLAEETLPPDKWGFLKSALGVTASSYKSPVFSG